MKEAMTYERNTFKVNKTRNPNRTPKMACKSKKVANCKTTMMCKNKAYLFIRYLKKLGVLAGFPKP
jgi:hypothetical protein